MFISSNAGRIKKTYQSNHCLRPFTHTPLGGVFAFHDIDLCLLKDIHFMSLVTSNQGAKIGVAAEIAEGAPREQQQVKLMRHHAMHRKMRFQKRQRSYKPGCSSG